MDSQVVTSWNTPYSGPNDSDPLIDDELAILLAIPRAAESTPNATLFRLPLGPEPLMGWVDATCAEVRSIVARLANVWKSRLSDLLHTPGKPVLGSSIGPGTTICITIMPDFHGVFHLLAFWALGCTVQYVSVADPSVAMEQLNESGCKVMLCSGFDDDWIEARKKQFDGVIVQLPEEEQAHQLAKLEKQYQATDPIEWPVPVRPTPALILQSSGTTGRPKLLRMSLYYYTIRHKENCQAFLELAHLKRTSKTPYSHPRLVPVPFYWSSAPYYIFTHLTTATPMAFVYFTHFLEFPPSQLLDWAVALEVGAISCTSGLVRSIPKAKFEVHAGFLQTLYSFSFTGSSMDNALSQMFEELKIPITNLYGSSELGRILQGSRVPYTHLRPFRGASPPLVHPISEYGADGSRYVELWFTPTMSPRLAHNLARGGVSMKLEPFPGEGPHHGELAVNLEDIFQELTIHNASEPETVYVHVGRNSDQVRLGAGGVGSVDAALYEVTLGSQINARIGRSGSCPWTLDGVQLFGNNMTCTSLVIQLCLDQSQPHATDLQKSFPIDDLYKSIEETNDALGLTGRRRVHTGKRTLVVSSDGVFMYGEGSGRLAGLCSLLSLTHKRTPKRWENNLKFKPWLDGLDFSES
ncbi:unnamed protein product [Rhizoctonia solani]|uniref:AMP-dependent synthetase/ligase domain-containing protein n=1 Tax=Rhizoctonia solani TaxID=456999 RepID=A0A8H3HIY9_9AGAM|nr:unnamed protein product [Rhizoctonia solani]